MKFDSALDEAIYSISLDGGADEEAGSSTEAPGLWAGLMRDGSGMAKRIDDDRDEFPNVTNADIEFLTTSGKAGAILTENTQGFVSVKYYASERDLENDWKEAEEELTLDDEELEPNARRSSKRSHRSNTSIADRRKAGIIEGLTKAEMDSMEIQIPTFDWKQIGGDMSPGAHDGLIARADGDQIELLEIQSVTNNVGKREAKDVGFPFWSKEAYYDLDDLSLSNEDVQSAIESMDLGSQLLEMTPEVRALAIAEACMSYGVGAEESNAGWAKDVLGSRKVVWWGSNGKAEGYEYIADEDDEFRREVLGEYYEVVKDGEHVEWFGDSDEDEAIEAASELAKDGGHVEVKVGTDEIIWDSDYAVSEGDSVRVRAHVPTSNRNLDYPDFKGTMMEDAIIAEPGDYDAVSVKRDDTGEEEVVYTFSIEKKNSLTPNRHSRNASGGFTTVAAIKAANKRSGGHFFDADTLRFWNSEIEPKVYGGKYFVTSEQFSEGDPRRFSVREADPSGKVRTVAHALLDRAEAMGRIADLLVSHTPNPRRWPVLMQGNDVMSSLLDMEAESMDPSGRGIVPKEVSGEMSYTDDLIGVVFEYESALYKALEDAVTAYPPKDDATADDIFAAEAPFLVLMTLRGEGVGIWDGDWDHFWSRDDLKKVQELLEKKLRRYADSSGSGRISEELQAVVYEAMREAGYGLNDDGYVQLEEGEEVGYEFKDTVLEPERVEEIVSANGIPLERFWEQVGGKKSLTRGDVDRAVSALGGKYAKNARDPRLKYALEFVLDPGDERVLVVQADSPDEAYKIAESQLKKVGGHLQGTVRRATSADIRKRYRPNMSSARRFNVFLNGELLEPVYLPASMTAAEVKEKLVRDNGYDERIVVDEIPQRRTDLPPHYRYSLRENRKWSGSYMNDLPDSAFLYIEPGGSEDADGRTVPRSLRHFPYKGRDGKVDVRHLRNALSRIPQSNVPEAAKRAARVHAEKLLAEHGGYQ